MSGALAVFDLDGTLLDTLSDLANACNYALNACGFPSHLEESYKFFVGNGVYTLIQRALPPGSDKEQIGRVRAIFDPYYEEHAQDKTRPYDGILDLLVNLRQRGINTAVLSNKPHGYVQELVEVYFPGMIDLALGQRDGIPHKPDPAGLWEVMAHFAASRDDCVYVGDSGVDIKTGQSAGVFTVGVLWGFRTEEELETAGADRLTAQTSDLERIILDKFDRIAYTGS